MGRWNSCLERWPQRIQDVAGGIGIRAYVASNEKAANTAMQVVSMEAVMDLEELKKITKKLRITDVPLKIRTGYLPNALLHGIACLPYTSVDGGRDYGQNSHSNLIDNSFCHLVRCCPALSLLRAGCRTLCAGMDVFRVLSYQEIGCRGCVAAERATR
jgi:hypothetical protein